METQEDLSASMRQSSSRKPIWRNHILTRQCMSLLSKLQSETRSGATGSDIQVPQMEGPLPHVPILGFYANNQFVPLTSASMSQSGQLLPTASAQPVFVGQPATLSQNLEDARLSAAA